MRDERIVGGERVAGEHAGGVGGDVGVGVEPRGREEPARVTGGEQAGDRAPDRHPEGPGVVAVGRRVRFAVGSPSVGCQHLDQVGEGVER